MRRLLLFVFCFFVCILQAFSDSYSETEGSGLFLNSDPSGAKVYIDGIERGTTPYKNSSMRAGEYSIRVTKEGYMDRRFTVIIRTGSCVEVSVDMEELRGQVILEFQRDAAATALLPFDPKIIVDGSEILNRNIISASAYEYNISLIEGWRSITVEAFGWERINKKIYVSDGSISKLEFNFAPAEFSLTGASVQKKHFNPRNPGAMGNVEINFTVNAPGRGVFEVLDSKDELIYTYTFAPFKNWQQKVLWNGKNNGGMFVDDGTYILKINIRSDTTGKEFIKEFPVVVDSSVVMRPFTASNTSAGLMFVPVSDILPAFSYQIEATVLAGKLLMRKKYFETQPAALGLRVSFPKNLELSAVLGMIPNLPDGAEWDIGASVKWVFFRPQNNFTSGSAGSRGTSPGIGVQLSYGWSSSGPYTVFGMGTGAGLRFPFLYRFASGETKQEKLFYFDLLLSPLFLWAGEEGHPQGIIPRLGMEGGIFFSLGGFAAGISSRWDYAPETETSGPVTAALEIKFFPSNIVFTVNGGYWYSAYTNDSGVFFGVGLGFMN